VAVMRRLTTGVVAASLTPLHDDLSANSGMLVEHCKRLIAEGCHGLVILGTTGEANSFTMDERRRILESVIAGGVPAERLIVGTGCCATGDSAALCRHALELGVTRVLMLPPFYYKSVSSDGVFEAFARTIEAVGDARLRVYLYLIPQMSGVVIDADVIGRLAAEFPEAVAGIKESSGDQSNVESLCRRFGSRLDVLVGNEANLQAALAAGAAGCVTATANAAAAHIRRLYDDAAAGKGGEHRELARDVRSAFESMPMIAGLKAYAAYRTGDVRWRNLRPPLTRLTAAQADTLISRVSSLLGADRRPQQEPGDAARL
jgi:4-hydroxy-tetrahydrodipicolinate synthase